MKGYNNLKRELKVKVIPAVVVALGATPKKLK